MGNEEEKKGFTIRDRRVSSPAGEAAKTETPEGRREKNPGSKKKHPAGGGLSAGNRFFFFCFFSEHFGPAPLGGNPDPVTGKTEKDLPLAKQTIDILGMLQEKTRGNLTADEGKLLENLLADLRWRYVREAKG